MSGQQGRWIFSGVMALNNCSTIWIIFRAELQDPDSPNYRKWLTPDEFADRFGPAPAQMQAVVNWLTGQGLQVTVVDPNSRTVSFSATYSQIKAVLQTRITTDGHDYANVSDPQVPAELAPAIVSIEGLTSQAPLPNGGNTDAIVSRVPLASGDSLV